MPFPAWETFYVIVGSSAGALTGLMFVVIALVADYRGSARQIDAFATPTVVHLSAVLLLSVIACAPWPTLLGVRIALGACSSVCVVYVVAVLRRTLHLDAYTMVLEDWVFHVVLPLLAYASILIAAAVLPRARTPLLFVIGGADVLLLAVGIHNAWDTVTYIVIARWEGRQGDKEPAKPGV